MKNIFILNWLTFDPGLALPCFRMYVSVQPCVQLFNMYVVFVDAVKCFVASALNTGVACLCLQLQIQMGLITG